MPDDRARTINHKIMAPSSAITAIEIGKTDDRAIHVGANSCRMVRVNPKPTPSLQINTTGKINFSTESFAPRPIDHRRYCSIATLES